MAGDGKPLYDPHTAMTYDLEIEHRLAPGEPDLWHSMLVRFLGEQPSRVLDFGAGTGLLMAALKQRGLNVVGLEPSRAMVERALLRDDGLYEADFLVGDESVASAIGVGTFDAIVCRQVLCHLTDPDATFSDWWRWLRPGGVCVAVDGEWPGRSWTEEALAEQPFASLQEPETVATVLQRAGFEALRVEPFFELNAFREATWPGSCRRYIVVARSMALGADPARPVDVGR